MDNNDIHTKTDVESIKADFKKYQNYLSELETRKQKLMNKQTVLSDIQATYAQITKGDYVTNLVEQERRCIEQNQQTNDIQKQSAAKRKSRR